MGTQYLKKKKKKVALKAVLKNVKMPWDSQRLKMGKKGAENILLSLSFLSYSPGK